MKTINNSIFSRQVISADNLAKKDIFGASDPYVRIDLVGFHHFVIKNIISCCFQVTCRGDEVIDSVLTKTKKRTLNPRWDEEFLFRLKPSEHKLVLEVCQKLSNSAFFAVISISEPGFR